MLLATKAAMQKETPQKLRGQTPTVTPIRWRLSTTVFG
jgi:hypothetical protein